MPAEARALAATTESGRAVRLAFAPRHAAAATQPPATQPPATQPAATACQPPLTRAVTACAGARAKRSGDNAMGYDFGF